MLSHRFSWVLALLVIAVSGALMALIGDDASSQQSPVPVPTSAESARADALRAQFPGGDRVPAIVVVSRRDGEPLGPADLAAVPQGPLQMSGDGRAAVAAVPMDANLSGFALNDAVKSLRDSATRGVPPHLRVEVTGGPAFGADIANSFSGANITLLAVTASVVALLLIVTYRSPVLWLVPLAVIAFADRVAAVIGSAIAEAVGMQPDGSTSGITSVLVFGAGTNYALLLISRYREELGRTDNARTALDVAVRRAGPAIIASNATVVLALLTLVFAAAPSTRSLGVQAASGLVMAAVFVLLVLPPLPALFGKRLFWPFIPHVGTKPPYRERYLASHCRCGGSQTGNRRVGRHRRARGAVHWTLDHTDRSVTDRTVPGASRIGQRLPDSCGALPQRADGPHPRDRADRPRRRHPTSDHEYDWSRVRNAGRSVRRRPDPVVGRPEQRTRFRRCVQNN
jgi:RND superfamily putative drug exporter